MHNDMSARLKFIGCDDQMRKDLHELKPIVDAELPAILDEFYVHLSNFAEPSAMFSSTEIMRHAKEMQIKHWVRITNAEFDADYVTSVTRIGETHYRLGLKPRWYIGGYALLISGLIGAVEKTVLGRKFGRDHGQAKRTSLIRAISTAALLDMDLAISIYLEAGEKAKQETLDWLSKSFSEIIEIVGSASTELEATASDLSNTASMTQRLTVEVTTSSNDASANVQSVASATEELGASVNEIRRQVQNSSRIAGEAVTQAEMTDARISHLSDAAGKIGDVVKLITAIADQTKLLALNATIEAERAGQAGLGFAVVAQEVKALAAQTAGATGQISTQIASIQSATQDSVNAIKEISRTINEIASIATSISTAVDEQGAATGEIASSAQQAASGTKNVATHIVEVNRGAMETGTASAQMLSAAQNLAGESTRLKSEVGAFIDKLRAA